MPNTEGRNLLGYLIKSEIVCRLAAIKTQRILRKLKEFPWKNALCFNLRFVEICPVIFYYSFPISTHGK